MGIFNNIKELLNLKKSIADKNNELHNLGNAINFMQNKHQELTQQVQQITAERDNELAKTEENVKKIIAQYQSQTEQSKADYETAKNALDDISEKAKKQEEKFETQKNTLKIIRSLQLKLLELIDKYSDTDLNSLPRTESSIEQDIIDIAPSLELPLHSFDVKTLRALSKENNKIIEQTLSSFEKRYTTKANKAIYQLMVIALRAELQNILMGLKLNTLDKCKNSFNDMINKYLQIASNGNQSIAPTLNTFIAEIKILFEKTIDIEYEYYVKKEQERAEQQALKEQMRQEAEERKELERQQKQIEKEESKFKTEIQNAQEQLNACSDNAMMEQLKAKIEELQRQLANVEEKKEEIINLQNGKAGYVYIISNLGSFGENRFKIGMTRRQNPEDRINELSSASVPFHFDIHSFIFSQDAVDLEHSLHVRLNEKRTNKVNLRKEFFDVSIDELESLVQELDATAEFNKTMLATEYRQSISM